MKGEKRRGRRRRRGGEEEEEEERRRREQRGQITEVETTAPEGEKCCCHSDLKFT